LNEAIDLETARWTAFQNRVPQNVIYVNAMVGLLAAMLVGYSFGVNGRRNIFSTCVLTLAPRVIMGMIQQKPLDSGVGSRVYPKSWTLAREGV
jgi:hypothetical protein